MREIGEAFDEAQAEIEAVLGEQQGAQLMLHALQACKIRIPVTTTDLYALGQTLSAGNYPPAVAEALRAVGERLRVRSLRLRDR